MCNFKNCKAEQNKRRRNSKNLRGKKRVEVFVSFSRIWFWMVELVLESLHVHWFNFFFSASSSISFHFSFYNRQSNCGYCRVVFLHWILLLYLIRFISNIPFIENSRFIKHKLFRNPGVKSTIASFSTYENWFVHCTWIKVRQHGNCEWFSVYSHLACSGLCVCV